MLVVRRKTMGIRKASMKHVEQILNRFEQRFSDVEKTYHMLTDEQFNYPDRKIYRGDWKFIGLKAKEDIPYPNLPISDILNDPLIVIAGFSIMNAGVEITPHRGYRDFADKVYRAHLCIKEAPNCLLTVDGKEYTWQEGKAFYFDDSLEHSAYNRSTETRIIMLFDIARDPNNIPELTENMMRDFD